MPEDSSTIDTPDLVASTGINDSSSPWNSLLGGLLQTGVNIGNSELQNALGLQTPVDRRASSGAPQVTTAPAPAVAAASAPRSGLGGLSTGMIAEIVEVIVLLLFLRK